MTNRATPIFPIERPQERIVIAAASAAGGATLALRPVARDDAGRLGAVFAEIEPWSRYPFTADALSAYLAAEEPGAPRYVIEYGDDVAGALGLRLNWLRGHYIQFLGIVPGYQNCGIGARVLDCVGTVAAAGEARNLWVAASAFNAGALRFYERHGFTRVASLDGLIQDGCDEILLRKRL